MNIKLLILDFDGVLTDNKVIISENIIRNIGYIESVVCSRADGIGIKRLQRRGIPVIVMTGEDGSLYRERCYKLEVDKYTGVEDKAECLKTLAAQRGIPLENIAYMGNDINDLEAMKLVGYPFCPVDAMPEVKRLCGNRRMSFLGGGQGCVRELCEYIIREMEKNEEQASNTNGQ